MNIYDCKRYYNTSEMMIFAPVYTNVYEQIS